MCRHLVQFARLLYARNAGSNANLRFGAKINTGTEFPRATSIDAPPHNDWAQPGTPPFLLHIRQHVAVWYVHCLPPHHEEATTTTNYHYYDDDCNHRTAQQLALRGLAHHAHTTNLFSRPSSPPSARVHTRPRSRTGLKSHILPTSQVLTIPAPSHHENCPGRTSRARTGAVRLLYSSSRYTNTGKRSNTLFR